MEDAALERMAATNALAFEQVLKRSVSDKLAWATRDKAAGWLDCTGCVWCVFDDPSFCRIKLTNEEVDNPPIPYQLFWSFGYVVMPKEADPGWVAERIRDEAIIQLRRLGYHAQQESRVVDSKNHLGVAFRPGLRAGIRRLWSRGAR